MRETSRTRGCANECSLRLLAFRDVVASGLGAAPSTHDGVGCQHVLRQQDHHGPVNPGGCSPSRSDKQRTPEHINKPALLLVASPLRGYRRPEREYRRRGEGHHRREVQLWWHVAIRAGLGASQRVRKEGLLRGVLPLCDAVVRQGQQRQAGGGRPQRGYSDGDQGRRGQEASIELRVQRLQAGRCY